MVTGLNKFSLGSQVGGSQPAEITGLLEQPLRDMFGAWQGQYTTAIKEFAFLLRIDGEIHQYTKLWNMIGAQKAKRKRDWVEVEIVVPEVWWREGHGELYRSHLVEEIEKGFLSMIDLLERNRHQVKAGALLADWCKVKAEYLNCQSGIEDDATIQ